MPKFNADKVDGELPVGTYEAEVKSVVEKQSDGGVCYWRVNFMVVKGKFEGQSFDDTLFFTPKGLKRVKLVLSRLGLKMEGEVDPQKDDLIGRRALVNLESKERQYDGKTIVEIKPSFDGYQPINDGLPDDKSDDLPF